MSSDTLLPLAVALLIGIPAFGSCIGIGLVRTTDRCGSLVQSQVAEDVGRDDHQLGAGIEATRACNLNSSFDEQVAVTNRQAGLAEAQLVDARGKVGHGHHGFTEHFLGAEDEQVRASASMECRETSGGMQR